jgi:hypothetical protein
MLTLYDPSDPRNVELAVFAFGVVDVVGHYAKIRA